ncbi:protein Fe65 homolog isoform X2 [Coccinella septempunctata]|uniref:protein Fe65 homolog isoform X2 n=1 Tax=Coccinella septempunctata TaxID=41139 RepID=UPI001D073F37|nr:protein Fe65 homolog isoform X2 [Coccinella septempunctata]
MLCGEFQSLPLALNLRISGVTDVRNPYLSLLALVEGMATIPANGTQEEEEDIYLENGLMSYENPNYHLDSAKLDDALNSNTTDDNLYKDIYQNIDICNMVHGIKSSLSNNSARKTYASLGIDSMGVDITTGPITNRDCYNEDYRTPTTETSTENIDNQEGEVEIKHITGNLNNDLYAVPVKRRQKKPQLIEHEKEEKEGEDVELPPGWEKHEDHDGPYYWHIKSGTIQRELPVSDKSEQEKANINNFSHCAEDFISSYENTICSVTRSSTSSALDTDLEERKLKESYKRRSYPAKFEEVKNNTIRFAVRSLGWVEISEDDLTPERSSKAVNKCIVDLSVGKNDFLDVVGRWGDGKDLFMDLDEGSLKLIDPENMTVLNTQPIHTIRVWGVGRDNGRERDFAYVARDRSTRKHMCHVFRCDMPARTIANTLRDICKKIMIERSLQQNMGKTNDIGTRPMAVRPTNLPTENRRSLKNGIITHSFPTPMEEPKKILRAQYLGSTQVPRATGMDVLNEAIDTLVAAVPKEKWQYVNVAIAPSMITIQLTSDELLAECRVRYLSFLGIGRIVKYCAFIMHTSEDKFIAHVFYCEPSSGALCKTIEAACKLRYQKCLDAHPQGFESYNANLNTPGKSIGAALKSFVGSITKRRSKCPDS